MTHPLPSPRATGPTVMQVLLTLLLAVPGGAWAQNSEADTVRSELGRGWTYLEAGNLRKAEEAFGKAYAPALGKNTAEVYYAISAVWWERRNAMAAYMWLADAQKASGGFNWDGGPRDDWDQRINQRLRYIAKNFTVVKLRAPKGGRPVPPLADPPPVDPLLRAFTDQLARVVQEGVQAKVAVQWVMLPNGTYWVGPDLMALNSGELDASKAEAWELVKDGGRNGKAYSERAAAIEQGASLAEQRLAEGGATALSTEDATRIAAKQAAVRDRDAKAERQAADADRRASRQAAANDRAAARATRSAGSTRAAGESLAGLKFSVAGGGGAVFVPRLTADGSTAGIDGVVGAELSLTIPVAAPGISILVGISYNNLPVSSCAQGQSRAHAGALHVGPRLGVHLRQRLWLVPRVGFHGGVSAVFPSDSDRMSCAEAKLQSPTEPVIYGARLQGQGGSARRSFADLGWRGWAVLLGGDAEIGLLGAPGQSDLYLGVALFLRHDQVIPILDEGTYYFRPEGESSLALSSTEVKSFGSHSMARLQFGLRGQVAF